MFREYETAKILDQSSYAHPCPHCKSGESDSQWVKFQKKIVYSPSIFLFHLDRYGKNISDNISSRSYHSDSYSKGQQLYVGGLILVNFIKQIF